MSDDYLDGEVGADRLAVWSKRLAHPRPNDCTIVAERDGRIVAFAHTIFDADPRWGALLDNLHVADELRGSGVGTRLMAETAAAVLKRAPLSGLFLWVLELNTNAQAFYQARGATHSGSEPAEMPGGVMAVGLRYTWSDPSVLLLR